MMSVDEANHKIASGAVLWIAGAPETLAKLEKGNWIGGTIHYFMDVSGGKESDTDVLVTEIPQKLIGLAKIKMCTVGSIHNIAKEIPDNGLGFVVIPAGSEIHLAYAEAASEYEDMFMKPLAGWVSGVHLSQMGKTDALVYNGATGEGFRDKAVVMMLSLKDGLSASVGMVNPMEPNPDVSIEFPRNGFSAKTAVVNGKDVSFSDYIKKGGLKKEFPLIADYAGAKINVSVAEVMDDGAVTFYAPVFRQVTYHPAKPLEDYTGAFGNEIPDFSGSKFVWSCNCVLNYAHMGLEGKKVLGHEDLAGPMTFGEIAYQLLNQTMVYLRID